jgi:hypothetical protein
MDTDKVSDDPMLQPYYSCDLSISIVNIEATSAKQAEAIMQKFIDEIAEVMHEQVRWNEADWEIQENVLDPETGTWYTNLYDPITESWLE